MKNTMLIVRDQEGELYFRESWRELLASTSRNSIVIGRSEKCDVTLESNRVSRKHCQMGVRKGTFLIQDLDSKNGTFVKGEQIQKTKLDLDDTFTVGDFELRIQKPTQKTTDDSPEATVVDEPDTSKSSNKQTKTSTKKSDRKTKNRPKKKPSSRKKSRSQPAKKQKPSPKSNQGVKRKRVARYRGDKEQEGSSNPGEELSEERRQKLMEMRQKKKKKQKIAAAITIAGLVLVGILVYFAMS